MKAGGQELTREFRTRVVCGCTDQCHELSSHLNVRGLDSSLTTDRVASKLISLELIRLIDESIHQS